MSDVYVAGSLTPGGEWEIQISGDGVDGAEASVVTLFLPLKDLDDFIYSLKSLRMAIEEGDDESQ